MPKARKHAVLHCSAPDEHEAAFDAMLANGGTIKVRISERGSGSSPYFPGVALNKKWLLPIRGVRR